MQIAFRTKSLRDLCENEDLLIRKFGVEVSMTLRRRLADLRAAGSIADIVVGNVRMASQAAREAMCVDLGSGYRLIFEPNHSDNPVTLDGNVDWQAVSRIKVNGVDKSDA